MLIAIPFCHEIPEFMAAIKKIPYDQLYASYMPEHVAYFNIRESFLNMPEYTHLAICPDDMIPTYEGIEKLVNNILAYNMAVHSGTCNVDSADLKDSLNICYRIPADEHAPYDFIRTDSLADEPDLIRVEYSGFPFMILHRSIVRLLTFRPNYKRKATDYILCRELMIMKTPIIADHSVRFHHMRYAGTNFVGIKLERLQMVLKENKSMELDLNGI